MCHAFLNDSRFYQFLLRIDEETAAEVRAGGCPCGGVLHSARYPRKPRGIREMLDTSYQTRLSFCCAVDGCRRRRTPPSVRFLGRKVYLGVVVILITALEHGLTPRRRQWLIETLDLWPQTVSRWRRWWRERFAVSPCWQAWRGYFVPPLAVAELPDALLDKLRGDDLRQRLYRLLRLLMPITTESCSSYPRGIGNPQKM